MKIIIFAGGTGTRFWPLSRKAYPKQFKKMFDGKSTLQLAVERIETTFGTDNIYISTNENYVSQVKDQLPNISTNNILAEPEKRNVGPSVGYCLTRLRKIGYKGPVAILWADHLIEHPENFVNALIMGKDLIYENPNRLIFIGEEPRYAENNLGWIHIGNKVSENVYEFKGWKYRPELEECKKMFSSKEWKWNPGYFVVDLEFTLELYKNLAPEMSDIFDKIYEALGTAEETKLIKELYPKLPNVHFDTVIAEKVPQNQALVVTTNMGWSDPGTLYALKESLVGESEQNFTKGVTYELDTTDSLIINEDKEKIITTIGLEGMVVVNTKDAMLVVHKDNVIRITELLEQMKKMQETSKYV